MVNEEPDVRLNNRYSINETCALLGITRKTLAKYTKAGLIKCGFRSTLTKFYTGREIARFWSSAV